MLAAIGAILAAAAFAPLRTTDVLDPVPPRAIPEPISGLRERTVGVPAEREG